MKTYSILAAMFLFVSVLTACDPNRNKATLNGTKDTSDIKGNPSSLKDSATLKTDTGPSKYIKENKLRDSVRKDNAAKGK